MHDCNYCTLHGNHIRLLRLWLKLASKGGVVVQAASDTKRVAEIPCSCSVLAQGRSGQCVRQLQSSATQALAETSKTSVLVVCLVLLQSIPLRGHNNTCIAIRFRYCSTVLFVWQSARCRSLTQQFWFCRQLAAARCCCCFGT